MGLAPLVPAAVYSRTISASLERIWENVLDWEHLPWLHRQTFSAVELIEVSSSGWRARAHGQPPAQTRSSEIEVILDRPGLCYLTRTRSEVGAGSEVRTRLDPLAEHRTRIRVEFCVPGLGPESVGPVGRAYLQLYTRLWDEDEQMMVRRAELLNRPLDRRAGIGRVELGPEARLRERLPLEVEVAGESFRVVEIEHELHAYPIVCPHRGGPLGEAPDARGVVACPWHGYRFDLRSGESLDGRAVCFPRRARVELNPETGTLFLEAQ